MTAADEPGIPSPRDEDGADERRLNLLRAIAEAGGVLHPRRAFAARFGHEYGDVENSNETALDLKYLSERDYLGETFFDRVSTCPKCESHHLNIREVCSSCRSTHVTFEPLLHHFRCGYVGRISEFEAANGKRICPKCAVQLKYPGTDHDRMGKTYLCLACSVAFQDPPASAVCLACETETAAEALTAVEVSSYALTSLGTSAVRKGTLFETDTEVLFIAGVHVYRPTVMMEMLRQEARKIVRYKTAFVVMTLRFPDLRSRERSEDLLTQTLTELNKRLRPTDVVGQLSDELFAVCLSHTDIKGAKVVDGRFQQQLRGRSLAAQTTLVAIDSVDDLEALLKELKVTK